MRKISVFFCYVRYRKSCKFPAKDLWNMETLFYDLYYPFYTDEEVNNQYHSWFNKSIDQCYLIINQ